MFCVVVCRPVLYYLIFNKRIIVSLYLITWIVEYNNYKHITDPTESSVSRDRDSDNEDWEEKEASRTHSVKFTEDVSEAKEVSLCCCQLSNVSKRRCARSTELNYRNTRAYKYMRYSVPLYFHNLGDTVSQGFRNIGSCLRNNIHVPFSRQRAYLALSSILLVLEWTAK